MKKKVILNLSVSQENKEFAEVEAKKEDGRYSSLSHWANELFNRIRRGECKCAKK